MTTALGKATDARRQEKSRRRRRVLDLSMESDEIETSIGTTTGTAGSHESLSSLDTTDEDAFKPKQVLKSDWVQMGEEMGQFSVSFDEPGHSWGSPIRQTTVVASASPDRSSKGLFYVSQEEERYPADEMSFEIPPIRRCKSSDRAVSPDRSETILSVLTPVVNNVSLMEDDFERAMSDPGAMNISFDASMTSPLNTSLLSNASSRSLVNKASVLDEDVFVRVGTKSFTHARAILSYASPVLSRHLQNNSVVKFPNKSPDEWLTLTPFLQPRSVQAAKLTPANIPTLLPWFDQLQLKVLVQECDTLLSSLTWPMGRAASKQDTSFVHDLAQSCTPQELAPVNVNAVPQGRDVSDVALLIQITSMVETRLPETRKQSLNVLLAYLENYSHLFVGETGTLDILQSLSKILEEEDARKVLWRTVIAFLPSDLQVYNEQDVLVNNFLFPYLLREGILKTATVEKRLDSMDNVDDSKAPEDPVETFHSWWTSWNNPQALIIIDDETRPGISAAPRSHQGNSSPRDMKGAQDRSGWLLCLWEKLQDPPIVSEEDVRVRTVVAPHPIQRTRQRRTFAC